MWLVKRVDLKSSRDGRVTMISFQARIRAAFEELNRAENEDPWLPTLRTLKGRVGAEGVERISTYDVFEALEVPVHRRSGLTVRLSRVNRRAKRTPFSG
jgi:hypothetical protein